ncbi:MAG TPA: hypothetical protein VHC67_18310 [Gaiellaceae bacterium]|nr:hypothetical protein [Gaiellaceae bacterium]
MSRVLLLAVLVLAWPASALGWGGTYPTGDSLGTSIDVEVSDSIPVDAALPQTWATFFGSLLHGPELASLTLDLEPQAEVALACGSGALACYRRSSATIFASPDDQPNEPSARDVLIHEYGHHISNRRSNAPWPAEDYGTKRWATYEHVCVRAENGTALPGNETEGYALNPGEAFAESYRVLNLTREHVSPIAWDVVDASFRPNATALGLLEQDVLHPWTGPATATYRGTGTRLLRVATPLDGSFSARTTGSPRLVLLLSGKPVLHGSRIAYRVCGQRTVVLRVVAKGRWAVTVSRP